MVIRPQGSYYNNTNVRLEVDMDLRVQIPTLMVRYGVGVEAAGADEALVYSVTGETLPQIASEVRNQLAVDCRKRFGGANVSVGNKAISVDGLDGSHADVDLVPAFELRYVITNSVGGFSTIDGVGISDANGGETWNFPVQHHANGVSKRESTAHRFQRVVRFFKRLNYELCETGAINRRLPSFLVECLVYLVENDYFLWQNDDRYDRILRTALRMRDLIFDDASVKNATEINEIKVLFYSEQAWTIADARNFIDAAISRLTA